MIRVVIDTNVLVSGVLSQRSPPAAILDLVAADALVICVSPAVLTEYHDVLTRRKPYLDAVRARACLDLMSRIGVLVNPTERLTLSTHDDDNRFLECAAAAKADYLITGNSRHFPKQWRTTSVVSPKEFLNQWQKRSETNQP